MQFQNRPSRCGIPWILLLMLLLAGNRLVAQWNFLGDPLISSAGVSSQSLALGPGWHPHLAYTSGGAVQLDWFDGLEWEGLDMGGLPTGGINDCALAFTPDGALYLALAPNLAVYRHDNLGWHPTAGLVSAGNAQGLQLRASAAGTLWLACFKAGATDTTYVYSRLAGGNWTPMGVLEGRLIDMELDDIGEPAVLLAHAPAILHRQGGIWQSLTPFSNPDEEHVTMQMLYDGSGTGAIVLRRDTSDGLTVEQLSFGNWTQLGTAGFATGDAADLGLSHSGIAHVVSVDHATNGPPRAYQFVAGNWQLLGGQFVFNNTVSQPQWAFDPGAAYLAFRDDEQALRNSVMYLGSPNAVASSHLSGNLRLWPNPVGATLHLELEKPIRHSEILITDALGRIVHQDKTSAENFIALDVRSLPDGQYFLTLLGRHGPPLHGAFFKLQ